MKNIRIVLIALILLIVFGGGYLIQAARDRSRSILSGTFETQPALLSARVAGRVKSLIAQEGDRVERGQVMALLDSAPDTLDTKALQSEVRQSQQAYDEALKAQQEQIAEQTAVVDQLRAALVEARNGPRPEEIHASRAALANAQDKYAEAARGNRPQEIAEARATYFASRANYQKVLRGGSPAERAKAAADVAAARAAETETKLQYERRQELYAEGAISAEVRDDAKFDYDAAVDKRKAAEESQADLNTRPEDIASAKHQMDQAQQHYSLLQAGSRPEDIAAARAARDQAAANLRLLLEGTRPEEIAQDQARLAQAVETLNALVSGSRNNTVEQARLKVAQDRDSARSSADKTQEQTLRAPKAANVERVLVADGELLSAGTALFRVSYPDDLHLRVYVPEQDLSHIRVGDRAIVDVDGISGAVECLVENIATQGEFTPANLQTPEERGKQVFMVRIRPAKPDPRLKAGMSATVRQIGDWKP